METGAAEPAVKARTAKALALLSLKRTFDLFAGSFTYGQRTAADTESQKMKLSCKILDEYEGVKKFKLDTSENAGGQNGAAGIPGEGVLAKSTTGKLLEEIESSTKKPERKQDGKAMVVAKLPSSKEVMKIATTDSKDLPSAQLARKLASKWPKPKWHPPWHCYRVISGHLGSVRSVAVDPSNEWFATGSGDRTIKFWDLASGQLKLTLTGHIEQVTGLAVSPRQPYMFSCALDKMVKCWDLEYNKVIRHYHGHLSGVYALKLHPTLDILMTGGRDSVCRVWDMRSKVQIHCLTGHDDTVCSILSQGTDPQVITGSHDKTVKLWDIRAVRPYPLTTLTYHKKSVRAMAAHPTEYSFVTAGADNIKKFALPEGRFLHNTLQNQSTILESMAVNEDGVLASGGNNGSLWFWDYHSGNRFQNEQTIVQPGSLESEAGINCISFDVSGSRLITGEVDKTIKLWREDLSATEESHPINFRPPRAQDLRRF